MRTDPRLRQTLNQISENLEVVNDTAQAGLFTFAHRYLAPCFASLDSCAQSCIAPCFPDREERLRRSRGRRGAGAAEYSFDFYDDWDEGAGARDALLGWDNDELDRLLAGSGGRREGGDQPRRRERTMSYGTARTDGDRRRPSGRRKTPLDPPPDGRPDPTVIPSSSMFGFLERLPWKIGGKGGRRYRPSAADLQDRPGQPHEEGAEPLLEEDNGGSDPVTKDGKWNRKRSNTSGSGETTDSLSSRGDLFPSDDEADAVALDDEFAMVLERRTTNSGADDASSRRHRGKRPSESRHSTKTSSRGTQQSSRKSRGSSVSMSDADSKRDAVSVEDMVHVPSLTDLQGEEERARDEEEEAVERKRLAAKKLAMKRGLSLENLNQSPTDETVANDAPLSPPHSPKTASSPKQAPVPQSKPTSPPPNDSHFVPARLPAFQDSDAGANSQST